MATTHTHKPLELRIALVSAFAGGMFMLAVIMAVLAAMPPHAPYAVEPIATIIELESAAAR